MASHILKMLNIEKPQAYLFLHTHIHTYIHTYIPLIYTEALVELFGGGVGSIHALEKHISSLSGTEGDEFDLSFMELAWLIIVKSRQNEVVT